MRVLLAMLAALSLVGCATTDFSSLDKPGNKTTSNLISADPGAVRDSIRQAVDAEYPGTKLREYPNGVFFWSLEPELGVDFHLQIFAAVGLDENKKRTLGLFYTVSSNEETSFYAQPLRRAIDDALQSNGAKTVKVKLLSKLTMQQQGEKLARQARDCFTHIGDNPAMAALKQKLDFDDGNSTFAMMTDTSKPTAEEKQAILRWGQLREKCLAIENTANDWLGIASQLDAMRNSLITRQQGLIAQLYMGNFTYAEFASRMQAVINSYKEQSTKVAAELKKAADEKRDREREIEATRSSGMTCSYGGGTMVCY